MDLFRNELDESNDYINFDGHSKNLIFDTTFRILNKIVMSIKTDQSIVRPL